MTIFSKQQRELLFLALLSVFAVWILFQPKALASGQQVRESHPRLLLDSATKAKLVAKKNTNDQTWTTLKSRADQLKTFPINKYTYETRGDWYSNRIMYGFQGTEWYDATMVLGLAYQISGDTVYSNKLLQLADEMMKGDSLETGKRAGRTPFMVNIAYASRYVGVSFAIIYDWCYDRLDSTRKSKMLTLMNKHADSLTYSVNGYYGTYENNGPAIGNYFGGCLISAAFLGYAGYGDFSKAQLLIDWARIRYDGTQSNLLANSMIPTGNRTQTFEGNYPARRTSALGNNEGKNGKPFKGGFNFQGWSYGTNEFNRQIDYSLIVKSATGEDLISERISWYQDMLRSLKHAQQPNKIAVDPVGDWGGNQGASTLKSLPARLAYILAETSDSATAQHFCYNDLLQNTGYGYYAPDVRIDELSKWEAFFFKQPNRNASAGDYPLFYSPFGNGFPQGGTTNGAMPRFITRSSWNDNATWLVAEMGASFYGDHQHYHAGHIYLTRGKNPLLISPANYRGTSGIGVIGASLGYIVHSSMKNTLFFDDWGDYTRRQSVDNCGGQSNYGVDRVVAAEQTANFTYVRTDLTTAYDNMMYPNTVADTSKRTLQKFYRNMVYLNSHNIAVVFDQIKAKNSTNSNGQYIKNLRWHVPLQPTITNNKVKELHGVSKMFLHTLLPSDAVTTSVNLTNNPDNRWGTSMKYAFNDSPTWRIEVKSQSNPLEMVYLTAIQAGDSVMNEMNSTTIESIEGQMTGARIVENSINYVLFNNRTGQTPQAITECSYQISGTETEHTLCGVAASANYTVSVSNDTVSVTQSANGQLTSTSTGVLRFEITQQGVSSLGKTTATHEHKSVPSGLLFASPNPATDNVTVSFALPTLYNASNVNVSLYNSLGQKIKTIYTGRSVEENILLSTKELQSGVYFIRIESDLFSQSAQFVVGK